MKHVNGLLKMLVLGLCGALLCMPVLAAVGSESEPEPLPGQVDTMEEPAATLADDGPIIEDDFPPDSFSAGEEYVASQNAAKADAAENPEPDSQAQSGLSGGTVAALIVLLCGGASLALRNRKRKK